MKIARAVLLTTVLPLSAFAAEPSQFISRVYFVIHESSPQQIQRGRRIIEKEFAETVSAVPQLQPYRYQVVSDGNQVVFSMVTQDNTRAPFQEAVSELVGQINGRFRTRGRFDFMKASLESVPENYLEVVLDETNTKIRSIVARSITLRDLLAELKMQFGEAVPVQRGMMGPRFSYMIPGDCASREIDWSFGAPQALAAAQALPQGGMSDVLPEETAPAKTLDDAMKEVAKLLNLSVQNHDGTFIFSGDCPRTAKARQRNGLEFLPARWIPLDNLPQQRVHNRQVPLLPVNAIE